MAWSRQIAGIVCASTCLIAATGWTAPAQGTGTIRGIVVDRADGAAIADVSVQLQDGNQAIKTDAEGRFELT